MTLNGVMALILPYFTEFLYDVVVKKFTFAVSSLDEFLVISFQQYEVRLIADLKGLLHKLNSRELSLT